MNQGGSALPDILLQRAAMNERRVVLNALLWMAKMDVPAGGVADGIVASDLELNLDPKRR